MKKETKKIDLVNKIIDIELWMFQNVKAKEGGHEGCQELPKTFRLMREVAHFVLSDLTLRSYLKDLEDAFKNGRNLMTEKYALMDDLIPHPEEAKEYVNYIAEVEVDWMTDLKQKYPNIIKNNIQEFAHYEICEYETYSIATLQSLTKDIKHAKSENINLIEKRYTRLFEKLGYSSLENANKGVKD